MLHACFASFPATRLILSEGVGVRDAEMLTWDRKWDTILDTSDPPFWKWWVGGRLNACVSCVDRHLASRVPFGVLEHCRSALARWGWEPRAGSCLEGLSFGGG
jgi:Acetyl-coenzyme A synthetase N-terminus